jgi:hypothetical protein
MSIQSAFAVHTDPERNLMEFRFFGHVTVAEMKSGLIEVENAIVTLRPGFTILTDLSGLESMDLDCASPLTKTMDLCRKKKIGAVVRVIPDPGKDIGFNILSIIHYRAGVTIRTFNTRMEAEKALAAD